MLRFEASRLNCRGQDLNSSDQSPMHALDRVIHDGIWSGLYKDGKNKHFGRENLARLIVKGWLNDSRSEFQGSITKCGKVIHTKIGRVASNFLLDWRSSEGNTD